MPKAVSTLLGELAAPAAKLLVMRWASDKRKRRRYAIPLVQLSKEGIKK
jgi:hypothetical protein